MSLFANDVLKKPQKETKESLTSQLLNAENLETKSRIKRVLPMSVYDFIAFHYSTKETQKALLEIPQAQRAASNVRLGDYLRYLGRRVRINGVSEGGQSRKEVVTAMTGLESEEKVKQAVLTSFFS